MRSLIGLVLTGLSLRAGAATTVLYDGGDAERATKRASRGLDLPRDQLSLSTLSELSEGGLAVLDNGRIELCASDPRPWADAVELLARAEGHINYGHTDEARAAIEAAAEAAGCTQNRIGPKVAARLFFLKGVLEHKRGALDDAFVAFQHSLIFAPDLAWDAAFSPRHGQDIFDSARADLATEATATLQILPAEAGARTFVDGRKPSEDSAELTLAPGWHLVQFGSSALITAWVELVPGAQTRLIIKDAVGDDSVSALSRTNDQNAVSAVLDASPSLDGPILALVDRDVWERDPATGDWARIHRAPGSGVASAALRWSGGTAVVGGVAGALASWLLAADAVSQCEQGTPTDCVTAERAWQGAQTGLFLSTGAAALGTALVNVGVFVDYHSGPALTVVGGQPGLRFPLGGRRGR